MSYLYEVGYQGAAAGENRKWAASKGVECLAGYDAYWLELEGEF